MTEPIIDVIGKPRGSRRWQILPIAVEEVAIPGLPGDKGATGDKGPTGDQGPVGDQGPAGDQGAIGTQGLVGNQGAVGDQGPDGDPGPQGQPGVVGDAGPVGDQGPVGQQGPVGEQGPDGGPGSPGADGASSMSLVDILAAVYPIGTIYESDVSTNPTTLFGFGTWAAYGTGRVLVAIDAGQSEFDVGGETGGAKTHTLTAAEMPVHTHVQDAHAHTQQRFPTATGGSTGFTVDTSMSGTPAAANVTASATATNQNAGSDGAHNNLQPYIVVYRWKRTA